MTPLHLVSTPLAFLLSISYVLGDFCPKGWVLNPSSSSCYLFTTIVRRPWSEAREVCTANKGNLLKVESKEEWSWIISELNKVQAGDEYETKEWWIGLHKSEGKWMWIDGTIADQSVIVWNDHEPNNWKGLESCSELWGHGLNDKKCSVVQAYICERPKNLPIDCHSNLGWESYNGTCYKFYSQKQNWDEASKTCGLDGGQLAIVGNQYDHFILHDLALQNKDYYWIGLRLAKKSENSGYVWQWVNGSPLAFNYWNHGKFPHVIKNEENNTCVMVDPYIKTINIWSVKSCDQEINFVCEKAPGVCFPGWEIHQASCYQFNTMYRMSWFDADQHCRNQGGHLMIILSKLDQLFLNSKLVELEAAGINRFWIGLQGNKTGFYWVKENSANFTNWIGSSFESTSDHSCVVIYTDDRKGSWIPISNCLSVDPFVCQIAVGVPVKKITPPPVYFTCPSGWLIYKKYCYQFNDTMKNWLGAKEECEKQQSSLVKILDRYVQSFINAHIISSMWIGLSERTEIGSLYWIEDNQKLMNKSFTNWAKGKPENKESLKNCIMVQGWISSRGKWAHFRCDRKMRFICQKLAENAPTYSPVISSSSTSSWSPLCGTGWEEDLTGTFCYRFSDEQLSWFDARSTCQYYGGDLTSIRSLHEQFFIAGRIRSMKSVGLWVGGTDFSTEGGWQWNDDTPLAFLNWGPGQPSSSSVSENCILIMKRKATWDDSDCILKNGYICKKLANHTTTVTATSKTPRVSVPVGKYYGCSSGWSEFQGSCFLVVPQKKDWIHAQNYCRMSGGDLVSISNNNEQYFIYSQLGTVKNLSIFWIGLNDKWREMTFYWSDNSRVTYTNWNRGEPNNYGLENCVLMTKINGKWSDYKCDVPQGFVCRKHKTFIPKATTPYMVAGCPQGTVGYDAYCYKIIHIGWLKSWQEAENYCQQHNGHLATVSNRFIQAFLARELAGKTGYYWIGLTDVSTPGVYSWSNGQSVTYTQWDLSHSGNELKTCIAMATYPLTGFWKNMPCSMLNHLICESVRAGYIITTTTMTPSTVVPEPCPLSWNEHQLYCYKAYIFSVNSHKKNWMESRDDCQLKGGDLVSIHTQDEEDFIKRTVIRYGGATYWIGLNRRDLTANYVWSDGTPVQYYSWMPNEPKNSTTNQEECVMHNNDQHGWEVNNCYVANNWICKVRRGSNMSPTSIPSATPSPLCGEDDKWYHYSGNCFYKSAPWGPDSRKTWHEAKKFCLQHGGDLASIHDVTENNFAISIITKSTEHMYWIGLNKLFLNGYQWSDGSSVDFTNWSPNEPNNANDGERCISMFNFNGGWNDNNCNFQYGFICKRVNGSSSSRTMMPTTPRTGGCPSEFKPFACWENCDVLSPTDNPVCFPSGNKCFYISGTDDKSRLNWNDSQALCKQFGASFGLASISSQLEQAFLISKIKNYTVPLWIGMTDHTTPGKYVWKDNSEVTFTNWNPGEPAGFHYGYLQEHCVAVYTEQTLVGVWHTDVCSANHGYICQGYKNGSIPLVTTVPPNSKPGYVWYDNSFYRLVLTPQTWHNALARCKSENGSLASINSIFERSFIQVLLANLDLSSWIGLSGTQGHYTWADNWPVLYTSWESGQPVDTKQTLCGIIKKSGDWKLVNCSQKNPFVCKITRDKPHVSVAFSGGICRHLWTKFNGYCYLLEVTNLRSWPEASYECKLHKSTLASFHSIDELQFFVQLLRKIKLKSYHLYSLHNIWIGLVKSKDFGFRWLDGTPVNFVNFNNGEPSDINGTNHEDCVELFLNTGWWNDINCFEKRGFLCKAPADMPSTTDLSPVSAVQPVTNSCACMDRTQNPPGSHIKIKRRSGSPALNAGQVIGITIGALVLVVGAIFAAYLIMKYKKTKRLPENNGFENSLYISPSYLAMKGEDEKNDDSS